MASKSDTPPADFEKPDFSCSNETVSVVIPVYNGATVIERALGSVLDQTLPAHEIILVNDGSTDDTAQKLAQLEEDHSTVRVLNLAENGGVSRARNRGNQIATGEWIALLDADDAYRPDRLERMIGAAQRAGADYVIDNLILHDFAAKVNYRKMFVANWEKKTLDQKSYWENCRFGGPQYSILKPIVKRSFIEQSGLLYDEKCGNGQDLLYHGEALALGAKAIILSAPLYVYTMRRGALSKKKNTGSQTKMNFAGIADRIDALAKRHQGTITPPAMRALRICSQSMRQNHTLNVFRAKRSMDPFGAIVEILRRPSSILLWLRTRYRAYAVNRPPYTF